MVPQHSLNSNSFFNQSSQQEDTTLYNNFLAKMNSQEKWLRNASVSTDNANHFTPLNLNNWNTSIGSNQIPTTSTINDNNTYRYRQPIDRTLSSPIFKINESNSQTKTNQRHSFLKQNSINLHQQQQQQQSKFNY
jgi:hypothetical protein